MEEFISVGLAVSIAIELPRQQQGKVHENVSKYQIPAECRSRLHNFLLQRNRFS